METMLDPPVCSTNLKCRLTTVSEAIEYIDVRLLKSEQDHKVIKAAREELYRAEDTRAKSVTSGKLANALSVIDISRN